MNYESTEIDTKHNNFLIDKYRVDPQEFDPTSNAVYY